MAGERDAMMVVRAELCGRLDRLRRIARGADFDRSVEEMRRLAAAYGLRPAARVAEAMQRAAGERPGAGPVALWLERMRDAIGCERQDEEAAEALIASVSVRLGA